MRLFHTRVFLLTLVPALALGDGLETVFARMDRSAASFRTLSSNVSRTSHTAAVDIDNTESGTMRLKRSKGHDMRMLVDLTTPDAKTVSLQGDTVDIYFPKIKTVQEIDLGKKRDLVEQFLLLGFGSTSAELKSSYKVAYGGEDTVNGDRAARLELIPKSPSVAQQLKKVDIWISDKDGYPIQQKLYLPAGDYMLVKYSEMKVNPDIPDSALKLKLPKGVKKEYPQK